MLKQLTDIRLSYPGDSKPGFTLHFHFAANEFFSDSELTKTYYYQVRLQLGAYDSSSPEWARAYIVQEQVGYGGDFVYDKAVGSDIKWKEGKDLTKKVEIKKQRNKSESRVGDVAGWAAGCRPARRKTNERHR